MRYSQLTDGRTNSGALVKGSCFTVQNPKNGHSVHLLNLKVSYKEFVSDSTLSK